MELITGVFHARGNAQEAVKELQKLGVPAKKIGLITPRMDPELVERSVPVSDSEAPGMGTAMGGTVGGAIGAAAGTTLGLAAASLIIPGVGPVIAFGVVGAALLGITGAAVGAAVGESMEENLGEGLPHEDVYLYEDALAHGDSVVVAYVQEGQLEQANDIFSKFGREELDGLRERWWSEVRTGEQNHHNDNGRSFESDETNYRRGFEAAQHPHRRGKSYAEVEKDLRSTYDEGELDTAFRRGYERGISYRANRAEKRKV
jgi:hypothetical protein